MSRKNLLKVLAYLVFFIFLLNILASRFFLYFSIWYFDMPMHFLGGFWLGLGFVWLFWPVDASYKTIFKIIACVLVVGALWELFEVVFYNYLAQNSFNPLDTISDICFDTAGGFSALFYVYKSIMPALENKVQ